MREPATSCVTCGAALLPAEVLYSPQADVVCAACFAEIPGVAQVRSSVRGGSAAVRTTHERRGAIVRWSVLFAILAASTLQVRHLALIRLHIICPPVSIDAPAGPAIVARHLIVRGHVAGSTATRPLWVVARTVDPCEACREIVSRPVIADPFGTFAVAMDLSGPRLQRYVVEVVSVGQAVDEWPPDGAAVLDSVVVFLGDDPPASSAGLAAPSDSPMLNFGDVLDAERY